MALVRSGNKSKIFEADTKFNSVFDTEYKPGETCEYEGIYKCTGCGKEVPRFYVSTSKSIIKALINMHSFEIQLSPIG